MISVFPSLILRLPVRATKLNKDLCVPGNEPCSEPNMDCKVDESSDVPILEERSSSPLDFPQDSWMVCTDIENIERYKT